MKENRESNLKRKILIVDDSEMNRALLSDILSGEGQILEASNGVEALAILHERQHEISLMLLDIVMPVMDGFEVLAAMNKNGWIKSIPVIMISAETSPTYVDRAYDLGVRDYINRPFDERTVRHRVNSTILMADKQNELANMVVNQIYEKEKDNQLMIEILSNIVEFRNGESGLHVLHIHTLTELLLQELLRKTDRYQMSKSEIRLICNASALHDIGKIAIPGSILNKPGRLTKEEFEIMKTHTVEGAKMLSCIPMRKEEPLVQMGYQICRWHHERYDGRGYPDGLRGEEIPIAAQVVALADVYDALTSKRVYKEAYSHEKSMEMILAGECGTFNPLLLECLQDLSEVLKTTLHIQSREAPSEMEMLNNVESIIEGGGLDVSNRTLRLLERERMKCQFYSDISGEIQFEYTEVPGMLTLSGWGASYLELPEVLLNPLESPFATEIFQKEDFMKLLDALKATTDQDPVVEMTCYLTIRGVRRLSRVTARALWSGVEQAEYEGAIGKIVDVQSQLDQLGSIKQNADKEAI
jgi:putative two-component system response regulator